MVTQWSNQDTNSGLSNTNMYLKLELAYYFVAKKLKTVFLRQCLPLHNALIIAVKELIHINE